MAIKVNWRDVTPYIGHETAIVWPILGPTTAGKGSSYNATPLQGFSGVTRHMIQPGKAGDYHVHFDREQVYYFTEGSGKMNIDEVIYPVKKGDAVCVPPTSYHHMINDTDEWLVHLIINGKHVPEDQQEKNKKIIAASNAHGSKQPIAHRHWLDRGPPCSGRSSPARGLPVAPTPRPLSRACRKSPSTGSSHVSKREHTPTPTRSRSTSSPREPAR